MSDNGTEANIFIISCGYNPNHDDCLRALEAQTLVKSGRATIRHIRNYSPMSKAFQTMIDTADADYFFQIDEDMILAPDSAERMLTYMQRQPNDIAFACFLLHDPHVGIDLQGCKIYNAAVMRKYPYNLSILSCEKDQLNRLRADGYKIAEPAVVVGEHSPKWTTELIFERYFDLMEKWKVYGYSWLEDLPAKLLAKYLADRSETNHYAYLGAQASASRPGQLRTREKDFKVRTSEYLQAKSWFSQPTQATLYLTDSCNLKCPWCLRQGGMAEVSPAPPFDATIVDELIRRFPSVKSVCLCGFGEPLLHPNIGSIIDRCKKYGLWVGLITNGTLLTNVLPTLLKHRPHSLSISLNAATPEEHAAETGVPSAWNAVMAGIQQLRAWRNDQLARLSTDTAFPVHLSRVCTAQNIGGIPAFLELAENLGIILSVDLHNILPHDVSTPEKEKAFLEQVLTVKHREQIEQLKSLPGAHLVRNWPVPIDPDCPVRRCESPFCTISIDGNRSVNCCNSVMPPQKEYGNIRDPKVWQSSHFQQMRLMFAEPELPNWCKLCFRNYM